MTESVRFRESPNRLCERTTLADLFYRKTLGPRLEAAGQRCRVEASVSELVRHTGAGLLALSGAVCDYPPFPGHVLGPFVDGVGDYSHAAGDLRPIMFVSGSCAHVQYQRRVGPIQEIV